MAGRPPCLWTCLSSLVKPVDLNNIKTAIYEKAWEKKHTNILPLKQSNAISSPKEPFLQDEIRTAQAPIDVSWGGGQVQM